MGYIHKAVNELEQTHAVVQQWAQQRGGLSLGEKLFDGLPMQWQLADLCTAVRKQYKDIKFLCGNDAVLGFGSDSTIVSVWAYFPGDAYLEDTGMKDSDATFWVCI